MNEFPLFVSVRIVNTTLNTRSTDRNFPFNYFGFFLNYWKSFIERMKDIVKRFWHILSWLNKGLEIFQRCWFCSIIGDMYFGVAQSLVFMQLWLYIGSACYLLILYVIIVIVIIREFWKYPPKCCLAGSRFRRCNFLRLLEDFVSVFRAIFGRAMGISLSLPTGISSSISKASARRHALFVAFVVALFPWHVWSGFVGQVFVSHAYNPMVRLIQCRQALAAMYMLARCMCLVIFRGCDTLWYFLGSMDSRSCICPWVPSLLCVPVPSVLLDFLPIVDFRALFRALPYHQFCIPFYKIH